MIKPAADALATSPPAGAGLVMVLGAASLATAVIVQAISPPPPYAIATAVIGDTMQSESGSATGVVAHSIDVKAQVVNADERDGSSGGTVIHTHVTHV